jgi:predicted RNase H-like nuclease (RuvC/YqgF family)
MPSSPTASNTSVNKLEVEATPPEDMPALGLKVEAKSQDLEVITGSLASLRGDVEQFLLEVSSANQELLTLVRELRKEVADLRHEVASLKEEAPKPDPFSALLSLRDAGAEISVSFGKAK